MDVLRASLTFMNSQAQSFHENMNPYLFVKLLIVLASVIVVSVLKLLASILEPNNYELDMTSGEYCNFIAEVNNMLQVTSAKKNQSKSVVPQQSNGCGQSIERQKTAFDHTSDSLNCSTKVLRSSQPADDWCDLGTGDGVKVDSNVGNNERYSQSPCPQSNAIDEDSNYRQYVYPNGWIPLIESSKVEAGKIKRAIIFGKDVIVTRSVNGGEVSVLDAYCPHMGVHIGVGGRVKEVDNQSCVVCPFHGWTFRASDGQCVQIPYQKSGAKSTGSIPKQAKLKSWISDEVDNFIYIWNHADEQPPSWYLKPAVELESKNWQLIGRSCHTTNLDLRDMHENGADFNHFEGIHNDLFIFGGLITKLHSLNHLQKYFRHHYVPEWKPMYDGQGKKTHVALMKLQSWISFFKLRVFDITVHAHQIGPARVNLHYDSKWYGRGLLTMNCIPLGGRRSKYIQHLYTERSLFQCFMAKWVLYGEIKMLERDLYIWNHKKNIEKPIFLKEDDCLKQFRSWYSQFYPRKKIVIQDSPRLVPSQENLVPRINKTTLDF